MPSKPSEQAIEAGLWRVNGTRTVGWNVTKYLANGVQASEPIVLGSEAEATAVRDALNRHTATREKNEMLRLLAPMKRDIVSVHP